MKHFVLTAERCVKKNGAFMIVVKLKCGERKQHPVYVSLFGKPYWMGPVTIAVDETTTGNLKTLWKHHSSTHNK